MLSALATPSSSLRGTSDGRATSCVGTTFSSGNTMTNDDLHRLDEPSEPVEPSRARERGRHVRDERHYTAPSDEREVHLLDYVRVLYKRRYLALTVFLVVLGSVAVYTFTATPIFEAKTRLLIESDDRNVVDFQQVVDEQASRSDYYQTQYNILRSRGLARKTMDDLKLWEHPAFGGSTPSEERSFWQSIKGMFSSSAKNDAGTGFSLSDDDGSPADETVAQSRAIDRFLAGLDISPIRNSRLVDVEYRSADPRLATRIANALAKNYIEQNLEYKFLASQEASQWLS